MEHAYILRFIATYLGFLWPRQKFAVTGSSNEPGAAHVDIESETVGFRITLNAEAWTLGVRHMGRYSAPSPWFNLALLRWWRTGRRPESPSLDEASAGFLRDNLAWVEDQFAVEQWPKTMAELDCLAQQWSVAAGGSEAASRLVVAAPEGQSQPPDDWSTLPKNVHLTGETKPLFEGSTRTLHRVAYADRKRAGGWIEHPWNLQGDARVYDEAEVFGEAVVRHGAKAYDQARVFGQALLDGRARASGAAELFGHALVSGAARIYGQAKVHYNSIVAGDAHVYDHAEVTGNSSVGGQAHVHGLAIVAGNAHVKGDIHINGDTVVTGWAMLPEPPPLTHQARPGAGTQANPPAEGQR